MRARWPRTTKIIVVIFVLMLAAYLLYRFSVVVPPLVLAALLAYILSPVADLAAERLRLRRTAAVISLYLLLIALLIAVPLLLIPELIRQAAALFKEMEAQASALRQLSRTIVIVGQTEIDFGALTDSLSAAAGERLQSFAEPTLNLVRNVVEFVVFSIIVVIVSFYLVKDGRHLIAALDRLVPPAYLADVHRLRDEINAVWSAFLRGQVILGLVVAVLITVVGFAVGLRFALALGILAGLLEFLPSLGHGLWLAIAVVVALIEGSTWLPLPHWAFALIIVGLHIVFQQADLNFLIPRIIGGHVHLHPLVVILGIVVGATLAGVLGVALAAPTIASARVLGRYVYAGLFDLDPFEPLPTAAPVVDPAAGGAVAAHD